jgi:hypothetical protein
VLHIDSLAAYRRGIAGGISVGFGRGSALAFNVGLNFRRLAAANPLPAGTEFYCNPNN